MVLESLINPAKMEKTPANMVFLGFLYFVDFQDICKLDHGVLYCYGLHSVDVSYDKVGGGEGLAGLY